MEKHGNKTIMCSVLFLDIVEYSRRSVGGQISLKERFNSYLSKAITNVPIADRIILDTGDGAAINFLGDIEDALNAALSLRESMHNEDSHIAPPLLMRMGINHGPVRLVRDINGQPNIVGDGINVAQRVMGFADAGQILVSRSYFDAVSRLSPTSAGMFHSQGARTDKHVREHEVYAITSPGDKTLGLSSRPSELYDTATFHGKHGFPMTLFDTTAGVLLERLKQIDPRQRILYAVALLIFLVVVMVALAFKLAHPGKALTSQEKAASAANVIQPISAVASAVAPPAESRKLVTGVKEAAKLDVKIPAEIKPGIKKNIENKAPGKNTSAQTQIETVQAVDAYISLICKEGAKLFVDGAEKGRIISTKLTVTIQPGKHKIIVASQDGNLYSQSIDAELGKTVEIKPAFCE